MFDYSQLLLVFYINKYIRNVTLIYFTARIMIFTHTQIPPIHETTIHTSPNSLYGTNNTHSICKQISSENPPTIHPIHNPWCFSQSNTREKKRDRVNTDIYSLLTTITSIYKRQHRNRKDTMQTKKNCIFIYIHPYTHMNLLRSIFDALQHTYNT